MPPKKGQKKKKELEEALNRSEKAKATARAKLKALEDMIQAGWRPPERG